MERAALSRGAAAMLLREIDFGSSVAEKDELLEAARVETSVFSDLLNDRVDLVPGTKGSGKSALYRMFVDFLDEYLLTQRKVVIAHGVQSHGDVVFHAYKDRFDKLSESDFVDFWCIYLVSLAHEQFVRAPEYKDYLWDSGEEVAAFRTAAEAAGIPEIRARKSLLAILEWTLEALGRLKPKGAYVFPEGGRIEVGLFGEEAIAGQPPGDGQPVLPRYVTRIKDALEALLVKADLSVWLMVDRLDEIFPRRSDVETRALRGLLRTLRIFESPRIRVKVFLRDDIFEQVTAGGEGFTALTHVTARQADTLRWSPEGIVTLITKRLFASPVVAQTLGVEADLLAASQEYREAAFYKVFPSHVYSPVNQSPTVRWIYARSRDGRGVVTPRDVIDLLTRAKQHQLDEYGQDQIGTTDAIIGKEAIRYGWWEMSKRKRDLLLKAEFPHLWPHIEKFDGGKAEYSGAAIRELLGRRSDPVTSDLVKVGLLEPIRAGDGSLSYKIPFLYRGALEIRQGKQA